MYKNLCFINSFAIFHSKSLLVNNIRNYTGSNSHLDLLYYLAQSLKFLISSVKGSKNNVGFIQLNKPKSLNALCGGLMEEMLKVLNHFDNSDTIKAIVITGNEKAFAAGADIKEMSGKPYHEVYLTKFLSNWDCVAQTRKPLIAAVNGFALGGGCELAMMCDIIYAADNAKFGQPEIKLGTIPGAGGTQRLVRAVGKSRAMELVLTGDMFTAKEAAAAGLISRVLPAADVVPKAIELAEKIAQFSGLATQTAKEAVNAAYNMTLSEGLHFEKRLFYATFATNDCNEGMKAFVEKRVPVFTES